MLSIPVTFELCYTHIVCLICFLVGTFMFQKINKTERERIALKCHCLYKGVTKWSLPSGWMLIPRLFPTWNMSNSLCTSFVFFQLPSDKPQQSTGCPCTGPVELGTLISASCTLESGGFDTRIYLIWSNYSRNTEKFQSYPKSVKPRRDRRGGTISPAFSSSLCNQLSELSCCLVEGDSYIQLIPA